jgi:hypothetical protein
MRSRPEILTLFVFLSAPIAGAATGYKLIGWNDLGMHCMDGEDFSVFGVLPPANTVVAQLIDPSGKRVKSPSGITVTYQAVADPRGSINTSSYAKTNFWQFAQQLWGAVLAPDVGLKGFAMPGAANQPKPMHWDGTHGWFAAEALPVTPFDDAGKRNAYPMMRLVARNSAGTVLAYADVVVPVSDEMDCRTCHASGSNAYAMPKAG